MLAQQISELALKSGGTAPRGQEDLALLTRELQDCVMAIRMQPVKSVFSRMPFHNICTRSEFTST